METESGKTKSNRKLNAKASTPIDFKEVGKLKVSNLLDEKAPSSIFTIESGREIFVSSFSENVNSFIDLSEFEILTSEISLSQKAFLPIEVTEFGMSTLLSRLREKA